jgi:hypothetical protein
MKKIILSEEQIKEMVRLYDMELKGSPTIAKIMGINKPLVLRTLKESGCVVGPSGRKNTGGRKVATKRYYEKHKEFLLEKCKAWHKENREYRREYHKEWREDNRDKWNETKRNYERNRKSSDPIYKLIGNFRTAIYTVLKENNVTKNDHYFNILGYSQEDLINHLGNLLIDGMTWDNYGEWHVDHVLPITHFKFSSTDDEAFKECWSLNNLQPLWGYENISKSNKLTF